MAPRSLSPVFSPSRALSTTNPASTPFFSVAASTYPCLSTGRAFFDGNIYFGEHDNPHALLSQRRPRWRAYQRRFHNLQSSPLARIQDRYPLTCFLQTFGYPMGSSRVQWLFAAAEILRIAGYDSFRLSRQSPSIHRNGHPILLVLRQDSRLLRHRHTRKRSLLLKFRTVTTAKSSTVSTVPSFLARTASPETPPSFPWNPPQKPKLQQAPSHRTPSSSESGGIDPQWTSPRQFWVLGKCWVGMNPTN